MSEFIDKLMSKDRPLWQRLLLWLLIIFLLFNTVGVALFFVFEIFGKYFGKLFVLILAGATLAIPIWRWHLKNVLQTWGNPSISAFTRREDPATGGYLFDIQPARATRTPAIFLFAVGVFFLFSFMLISSVWIYILSLIFIGVGCSFVLPGARYRKPARVSVSKQGIEHDDFSLPLTSIAEIKIVHNGLVVAEDPIMPGPNGVPVSSMLGRHWGHRQAERDYCVEIRAEGNSEPYVLAGGLTLECAIALVNDINKARDEVSQTLSG